MGCLPLIQDDLRDMMELKKIRPYPGEYYGSILTGIEQDLMGLIAQLWFGVKF
jgi:hypothetical protein